MAPGGGESGNDNNNTAEWSCILEVMAALHKQEPAIPDSLANAILSRAGCITQDAYAVRFAAATAQMYFEKLLSNSRFVQDSGRSTFSYDADPRRPKDPSGVASTAHGVGQHLSYEAFLSALRVTDLSP